MMQIESLTRVDGDAWERRVREVHELGRNDLLLAYLASWVPDDVWSSAVRSVRVARQFSRPAPDSGVGPAGSPLSGGVVSSPRGASAGDGERMRPGKDAAPTPPGPVDDGSRECPACDGACVYLDWDDRPADCNWCDGGGTVPGRTFDLYVKLFRSGGAA